MVWVDLVTDYQVVENGHWVAWWSADMAGHEAATLSLRLPLTDERAFSPRYLLLDGVTVDWLDADADAGRIIRPSFYRGGVQIFLEHMVTIGVHQSKTILMNGLRMEPEMEGYFMIVDAGGAGEAADQLAFAAWGRYESPTSIEPMPGPQPVSLEGYRWPLTRR